MPANCIFDVNIGETIERRHREKRRNVRDCGTQCLHFRLAIRHARSSVADDNLLPYCEKHNNKHDLND